MANLAQRPARAHEESFAGMSETYPAMMTNKERGADLIFQIPNAAAYGRFLDVQRLGRTPETATLGSRNNIRGMAQFDRQATTSLMNSLRSFGITSASDPPLASANAAGPKSTVRISCGQGLDTSGLSSLPKIAASVPDDRP